MKTDRISIFDTTLRDGEQTPGFIVTPEEKVEIARQLDRLGVDIIEAGSPMSSEGEVKSVTEIKKQKLKAEIIALARPIQADIDAAMKCDVDAVHVFISTSDVQMKYALNMTPDQVLAAIPKHVQYVKDHGLVCEFSPMDATRTEMPFLKKACLAAQDVGADRIDIPDTVGVMTPAKMRKMIEDIRSVVKTPISVHCHNDFGMAVANSLASVEAGAAQVHVTVNGVGERAGNASLEEVVMGLHMLYGLKTGVDTEQLYRTSQLVSGLSGIPVQPNKAIVGENAFSHESGIHTRGIVVNPLTFEPIDPTVVGRRRKLVAGKLAGRHGIKAELANMGFEPNDQQLLEIVKRVKDIGDQGVPVTDADLMDLATQVMGKPTEEKFIDLNELAVMTGNRLTPTASIKVTFGGKTYTSADIGVGPVDAAVKALQSVIRDRIQVGLREYRLEALSGGSDAVAAVTIKLEDRDGYAVSARGTSNDIVMASVNAMMTGINSLLLRQGRLIKRA